jgi:hypothetical protein
VNRLLTLALALLTGLLATLLKGCARRATDGLCWPEPAAWTLDPWQQPGRSQGSANPLKAAPAWTLPAMVREPGLPTPCTVTAPWQQPQRSERTPRT